MRSFTLSGRILVMERLLECLRPTSGHWGHSDGAGTYIMARYVVVSLQSWESLAIDEVPPKPGPLLRKLSRSIVNHPVKLARKT